MSTQAKKKTTSPKAKKVGEARTQYQVRSVRTRTPRPNTILAKCKKTLSDHYGERLKGLILYGSMARKQATASSDIDLLVLLAPPLNYFTELRKLVDVLYPIQLESSRLISAKPVSIKDFEAGSISLYRNAKREGIAIR